MNFVMEEFKRKEGKTEIREGCKERNVPEEEGKE